MNNLCSAWIIQPRRDEEFAFTGTASGMRPTGLVPFMASRTRVNVKKTLASTSDTTSAANMASMLTNHLGVALQAWIACLFNTVQNCSVLKESMRDASGWVFGRPDVGDDREEEITDECRGRELRTAARDRAV